MRDASRQTPPAPTAYHRNTARRMSDETLLASYNLLTGDADEPWSVALSDEIERRNLDL